MSKLDYEGYTRSLEKILDGLSKDYWSTYIDINRHQVNVGKTYLWVSAALLGVYSAAYEKFHELLVSNSWLFFLSGCAFVLACIAFGICLYAIPARKGYKAIPNSGWGEFSHEAYQYLKAEKQEVYATFLTSHINKVDQAFAHNFKTNQSRASLLRITSWVLIASFVIAVLVSSIAVFKPLTTNSLTEEVIMGEESKDSDAAPESSINVPEPPPPADIGGGNISTHSQQDTGSITFTTDQSEKK